MRSYVCVFAKVSASASWCAGVHVNAQKVPFPWALQLDVEHYCVKYPKKHTPKPWLLSSAPLPALARRPNPPLIDFLHPLQAREKLQQRSVTLRSIMSHPPPFIEDTKDIHPLPAPEKLHEKLPLRIILSHPHLPPCLTGTPQKVRARGSAEGHAPRHIAIYDHELEGLRKREAPPIQRPWVAAAGAWNARLHRSIG